MMAPIFGLREPPANLAAEQALLGALLANNKAHARVAEFLRAEHFADPANARIYAAIVQRIEAGHLADAVTLKVELEHAGTLDAVGGVAYLAQLLGAMVGIINAGEYGRAIHDAWVRRQLIDVGETLVNEAFGANPPGEDGQTQIGRALERLLSLGEVTGGQRGAIEFGVAARAVVQRAEAAHRGDAGHQRLDTGLAPVDALWGGLWPGQLYYLMARSRTGKTPAMLQFARQVAAQLRSEAETTGRPMEHVHVFSLEMTAEDLLTVNLAATTRWTADEIRAGRIGGAADWLALNDAATELGRLPIVVDDQGEIDIGALALRARTIARQKHTRLICVDFRELIRRPREHAKMGLPEWVPFLGYQLKALAKALNVPVLALAQINKSRDGQETTRPTLSDLPYDGGQAADGVFALHRPELYMDASPPKTDVRLSQEKQAAIRAAWHYERAQAKNVTEFIALKRRFGPQASCRLQFLGPRMLLRPFPDSSPQSDLMEEAWR